MRGVEETQRLADLAVDLGANVQPGQLVRIAAEVGHLDVVRAVAESAYRRGARFVDVRLFDPLVQRARILHVPAAALEEVPSWEVERIRVLGEERGASISITGPTVPWAFDDLDPGRVGRVSLPWVPQWRDVESLVNWTVIPFPTPAWAAAVRPELSGEDALAALWKDVVFACRLDESDPAAAWRTRLGQLGRRAEALNELSLDSVRFHGPGTDVRVGVLAGARWEHPAMVSARGVEHMPNLPTEEIFTVPDPARVDGVVRLTRPALVGGRLIHEVTLEFRGGRVAAIEGPPGVQALREFVARDDGASRLGELALVDASSRVGQLGKTFGVILLDENAVSHVALGFGFPELVADDDDRDKVNRSAVHLDVMVGSDEIAVTGLDRDGRQHALLRRGEWAMGLD
jgi:aminopeptidase